MPLYSHDTEFPHHFSTQNRNNNLLILPDLAGPIISSDIHVTAYFVSDCLSLNILFFLRYCAVLVSGRSLTRIHKHVLKTRESFSEIGYRLVKLHCKYFTHSFSMWTFQVFVVSLLCMYLFIFLGMSKVETPPLTPVRSKEVWLLPFFLDGSRSSLSM